MRKKPAGQAFRELKQQRDIVMGHQKLTAEQNEKEALLKDINNWLSYEAGMLPTKLDERRAEAEAGKTESSVIPSMLQRYLTAHVSAEEISALKGFKQLDAACQEADVAFAFIFHAANPRKKQRPTLHMSIDMDKPYGEPTFSHRNKGYSKGPRFR